MRTAVIAIAALAFAATSANAAPTLDKAGKCSDAGKFVAASMCKAAAPAPAGKCRDMKTKKFAKCGMPGTEHVPKK